MASQALRPGAASGLDSAGSQAPAHIAFYCGAGEMLNSGLSQAYGPQILSSDSASDTTQDRTAGVLAVGPDKPTGHFCGRDGD